MVPLRQAPRLPEAPRRGADPAGCPNCYDDRVGVCGNENWRLNVPRWLPGVPFILLLEPHAHHDLPTLPDDLAAELGLRTAAAPQPLTAAVPQPLTAAAPQPLRTGCPLCQIATLRTPSPPLLKITARSGLAAWHSGSARERCCANASLNLGCQRGREPVGTSGKLVAACGARPHTTGVNAPPAEGVRVDWADLPLPVRAAIESVCGAPVIDARTQPGGFSPGLAARVRCADGTRSFVKAASAETNVDSPEMHRREASVLASLDPLIAVGQLSAPRLLGTAEAGPWFALIVEDVAGCQPALPWRDAELDLVLAELDRMATVLTPAPVAPSAIAEDLAADFTGWRTLARTPGDDRIDPWSRARLRELAALEATWPVHASGSTLLHCDIRADNLLLTGDGVVVVDWPHACRGAAFVDLVCFAPSVAMQGGPDPTALLARSRVGREAGPDAVAAVACALAGYFTERSLRPPPPGLPTVRRFQAAQAEVTCRWLASLL